MTELPSSGSPIAWTINPETVFPIYFDAFTSNLYKETLIDAINGRRRRKRDTSNNETANGKMMARFSFAKSPVTVRREMSLLFRNSYQINIIPCLFQCFTSTKAPYT